MANVVSTTTHLIDTAIGPFSVTESTLTDFDIDDFVHTTVIAQAVRLQVLQKIITTDPRLAKNRPPVIIDGQGVGGF